jgi:hypothetical protein
LAAGFRPPRVRAERSQVAAADERFDIAIAAEGGGAWSLTPAEALELADVKEFEGKHLVAAVLRRAASLA